MKKLILIIMLLLFANVIHGQFVERITDMADRGLTPTLVKKEFTDGILTLTLSQTFHEPAGLASYSLIWKEVYIAEGGKVVLENLHEGKYRTIEVLVEQDELYYEEVEK